VEPAFSSHESRLYCNKEGDDVACFGLLSYNVLVVSRSWMSRHHKFYRLLVLSGKMGYSDFAYFSCVSFGYITGQFWRSHRSFYQSTSTAASKETHKSYCYQLTWLLITLKLLALDGFDNSFDCSV
jgi:hypothetical protein